MHPKKYGRERGKGNHPDARHTLDVAVSIPMEKDAVGSSGIGVVSLRLCRRIE